MLYSFYFHIYTFTSTRINICVKCKAHFSYGKSTALTLYNKMSIIYPMIYNAVSVIKQVFLQSVSSISILLYRSIFPSLYLYYCFNDQFLNNDWDLVRQAPPLLYRSILGIWGLLIFYKLEWLHKNVFRDFVWNYIKSIDKFEKWHL